MKEKIIIGANELQVSTYIYDSVQKPTAVVLIIHGMQEHAKRYTHFAEFLNKNDIIVYTSDLRGHGKTSGTIQGYDAGDIYELTIADQKIILDEINKQYSLPIFILGHSYGSFLTQTLFAQSVPVNGIILSGSTYTNTLLMKSANIIAKLCGITGDKKQATLIEKMSLKDYGKKFKNGNWLSRNEEVWNKYQADQYCGKPFPVSFYKSFFKHIIRNYKGIKHFNTKTPLLLIGGTQDPVSSFGKGLTQLYGVYKKNNLNVEIKQYEDARHEILNETNKEEVYNDILIFIQKHNKK